MLWRVAGGELDVSVFPHAVLFSIILNTTTVWVTVVGMMMMLKEVMVRETDTHALVHPLMLVGISHILLKGGSMLMLMM